MPARPIARVIAVLVCLASAEAAAAPATFTFPPGGVLKSVLITNTTPCAGRQVLIAVNAQDPEHPTGPVEIYIDGAPGTPQALQYFAVNPARKISIFAITPSRLQDRKEITISVQSCPEVTTTLELLHSRNPYRRDHVDFHAVLRGGTARAYFWQFGDGTTATTREPFVSHDYSATMEQQDKFTYFNASVTATGPGLISTRRIAIGSSFAMSRSMGFIQADVKHTLTPTGQGFVVGYQIRNHHGTPITFRQYLKQYLPCDYRQPTTIQAVAAETVLGNEPRHRSSAGGTHTRRPYDSRRHRRDGPAGAATGADPSGDVRARVHADRRVGGSEAGVWQLLRESPPEPEIHDAGDQRENPRGARVSRQEQPRAQR